MNQNGFNTGRLGGNHRAVTCRSGTGRPIVGVDLANGRAWASAVAWYGNGRTEALAVCPGIPDIAEQERRDNVCQVASIRHSLTVAS